MTYAEKLSNKIISSIKRTRDANPNYPMDYLAACKSPIQKHINEAMQAQREACAEEFERRFSNYNDVAIPSEEIRKEMEACLRCGILYAEVA